MVRRKPQHFVTTGGSDFLNARANVRVLFDERTQLCTLRLRVKLHPVGREVRLQFRLLHSTKGDLATAVTTGIVKDDQRRLSEAGEEVALEPVLEEIGVDDGMRV